jgi:hypothetical protein
MKKFILPLLIILSLNFIYSRTTAQTTKTVGSDGDYATLNAAFADVSNNTLKGEIVFQIISDITETTTTSIYESGSGSWEYSSITIYPTGSNRTITNNTSSDYMFYFYGCHDVIIDGRINQEGSAIQLTLENTVGNVVNFIWGAHNNIIRFCHLKGNNTAINEGLVVFNAVSSKEISSNFIDNCSVGGGVSTVNAVYTTNETGVYQFNMITNCNIIDVWSPSLSSKGIYIQGNSLAWAIGSNSFYQTSSRTATAANTHYGIYINGGDGHNISNNYIGGSEPLCAGTAWTIEGEYANRFVGIYLNVGTTYPANVQNNIIYNFNHTYHSTTNTTSLPGIWCGIYLNGGDADFSGNFIGSSMEANTITVNSTSTSNVTTYGIGVNSSVSTPDINGNYVGSFTLNSSSTDNGHSFTGIQVGAASDVTIRNNTVGHQTIPNFIICTNPNESTDNEQNIRGIVNTANTNVTISNNTIANLANSCLGKGDVVGIYSDNGVNNIVGNSISMLANASGFNQYNIYNVTAGIALMSNLDEQLVNSNTIHNLSTSYSGGSQSIISGILFREGSGVVSQNVVFDISFATDFYGIGNGIWLLSPSDATVINNAIRLGVGEPRNNSYVGIQSYGNNTILGNSVYIGGMATNDFFATYAYRKDYSGTDRVYNNIFYNARESQSGGSENYAIGKSTSSVLESDFNNLYSLNPDAVISTSVNENYFPTGSNSLAQWQTNTGNDANSLSVDPLFAGVDEATPDLHITASSPMINMGTSIYPLIVDIDDDMRDMLPDIGCDEFYTGSILVGTGETYETLKAAFDAINAGDVTGNISINIQSNTTETATATLYQSGYNGTSDYTSVSVGTASKNITVFGNIAGPIVSFNGAHNVNMVNLTIKNENSGGYCVEFTNSASNNRIAGCNLLGATQLPDKGLITFSEAGSGEGNNDNLIEICSLSPSSSDYRYGIVSIGTADFGNGDNTISDSRIYNFWSNEGSSAGIYLDENNANWEISKNHLYQTEIISSTGASEQYGIYSLSASNINISNNFVGGREEECGGSPWTVWGFFQNTFTGIYVDGANDQESYISNNTISNFHWESTPGENMYEGVGVWTGIGYGGGTLNISDNTIGAGSGNNSIQVISADGYHVASYGIAGGVEGANVTISDNTIGSIDVSTSSENYSHCFTGIQNNGATEINISGNLIGSESSAKSINASTECTHTATGQHVAGIVNNANTASCTIEDNIVKNLYNSTVSGWSSYSGSPFGHMVIGIAANNGANLIEGNTISNLTTTSFDTRVDQIIGIYAQSDKPGQVISGNIIFGLNTSATDQYTKLSGISYVSPESGTNLVTGNRIYGITSSGSSATIASEIKGIHSENGKATVFYNNMVSLGSAVTHGHNIYGIISWIGGEFYHNSVAISGNVTGSLNGGSFAFMQSWASSELVVMNNIFVNTRTNGSHNNNYAFSLGHSDNADDMTLNYNAYWADGTGTVLAYNGTSDVTALPILAGKDANSINSEVTFTNTATADLHTSTAALNASALVITGITTDFDGNTRNPQFPDIGADEFIQPLIPALGSGLDFGWTDVLTPKASQSYELTGIDLTANMVVTAPDNFQVSLESEENFTQSLSIAPVNTNVETTIYARYLPDVEGFTFGNIINSSSGAEQTIHVQGSARAIHPVMETGSVSDITTETAEINAEILHTGGRNVLSRGIIYWPYDGEDKEIGDPGVVNVSETGSFEKGEYFIAVDDLEINTHYNYRSYANNGDWDFGGTGYGETLDFWTHAELPSAPVVDEITASTVRIALSEDGNPDYTEYAIFETTISRYIQDDGTMSVTPVWKTFEQWGEKTVSLYATLDLTGNRQYIFGAIARNGATVQTGLGETESIITLAHVPNPTYLHNPTETTMHVSVFSSSMDYSFNTLETQYAIVENNLEEYIQLDGTLGVDIEWGTRDQWYLTLIGLSIATEYSFSSIARNDDGIETEPSTPSSLYTHAAVPGAPSVITLEESVVQVTIDPGENPDFIEYCIIIGSISNNNYVNTDGTFSYGPGWQIKALWDETPITAFNPNADYSITIMARNDNDVQTASSEESTFLTTAVTPPPPYLYLTAGSTDQFTLWQAYIGSNPNYTELAFQDSITEQFVQPDGAFGDNPAWQAGDSWNQTDIQAEVATRYALRAKARNLDGIETAYSLTSKITTYPYPAGMPTLSNITSSSVDVEIDPNGNPGNVEYAIQNTENFLYVQANGSFDATPVWQTLEDWDDIAITGLQPDSYIGIRVYSRSIGDQVVSNDQIAYTYTLANIPDAPDVEATSSTSITLTINPNGNPITVRYAIYESNTEMYLGYDSQLSDDPVWFSIEYSAEFGIEYLLPSTGYTFKVKARNSDLIETEFGPETSITTPDGPPIAPTLVSPENESTDLLNSILFSWNELSNADTYSIQVASSPGFYEYTMVFEESDISDIEIQIDNLLYSTTMYWRVNATNEHGTGSWSSTWSFTTMEGPPAIPALLYPENGATEIPPSTSLAWSLPDNTDGFNLQVSLLSDFSTLVIDSTYSLTSWNDPHYCYISNLSANTTYYWRVSSWNEHGSSSWSEEWSFTTINAPDPPELISPANGSVDMPTSLTLYWNSASLASYYDVQVALDEDFETLLVDMINWVNTEYTLYSLEEKTTYYWRIRSINQWFNSEWSDVWWFKTQNGSSVPAENYIDIRIYPNPVENILYLSGDHRIDRATIISEIGVVVEEIVGVEKTINTSNLKPGVYILKLYTGRGSIVKRFVKQ